MKKFNVYMYNLPLTPLEQRSDADIGGELIFCDCIHLKKRRLLLKKIKIITNK